MALYSKRFCWLVLIISCLSSNHASAWWYGTNVTNGADIIVEDVRWPQWPHSTYFALWNTNPMPTGGYMYGGVATHGKGGDTGHLELVWTYWNHDAYHPDRARVVGMGEVMYGGPMFGEGASCNVSGHLNFMKTMQWYRFVMRSWPDTAEPEKVGYNGWWVKDLVEDRWYKVAVVRLPVKVTGFSSPSSFIEVIGAPGKRQVDRRGGYHHVDGKWKPTDWIVQRNDFAKSCTWEAIEDGTVRRFTNEPHGEANKPLPHPTIEGWSYFPIKGKGSEPVFEKPEIESVKAQRQGDEVLVQWVVPDNVPPQLGYHIALLDKLGNVVSTRTDAKPDVKMVCVEGSDAVVSAQLTVTDIFNQTVSRDVEIQDLELSKAVDAADAVSGLNYLLYRAPEGVVWDRLPNLGDQNPMQQGRVYELDDTVVRDRSRSYALVYRGYLKVPESGVYVFDLRSSDGSRLKIDGKIVVDNDGLHSAVSRRGGVALHAGLHHFELMYFESPGSGVVGRLEQRLWLGWEGPGFGLQKLPSEALRLGRDQDAPSVGIKVAVDENNISRIEAVTQMRGHTPTAIEFYRGNTRMAVINNVKQGTLVLERPLPGGDNALHARLWYDEGRGTVDTPVQVVSFKAKTPKGWQVKQMGEVWPGAISGDESRLMIYGEGRLFGYRTVKGDFTLTTKLKDVPSSDQTDGVAANSRFGVYAIPQAPGGGAQNDFAIWQTAGMGMRGTSSDRDLETSRQSRWAVSDKVLPWVRLIKRGRHFRAYASEDGKNWQLIIDRVYRSEIETTDVGIAIDVPPNVNRTLFGGVAEQIMIEQPGPDMASEPTPAPDTGKLFIGRAINIVTGPGKEPTLYLRTYGDGVRVSRDLGKSWQTMKLPDAAQWVRSIAVHPKDPDTLLLGAGNVKDDGGKNHGLWRSEDAGQTWTRVTGQIDFRGDHATAFCGEVIAFDQADPRYVVAGGDSVGVMVSEDGGRTWKPTAVTGERITFIKDHPLAGEPYMIGTCADGEWGTEPGNRPGRVYAMNSDGQGVLLDFERDQIAINNIYFEGEGEAINYNYYATTRGVYYCYNRHIFFQYRNTIETDTVYTAIAGHKQNQGFKRLLAAPLRSDTDKPLFTGSIGYYWQVVWSEVDMKANINDLSGITPVRFDDQYLIFLSSDQGVWRSSKDDTSYKLVLKVKHTP